MIRRRNRLISSVRAAHIRMVTKWVVYVALLLLVYVYQTTNSFLSVKPLVLLPLTLAVAMFEREFSSAIFGAFAGLSCDMAMNSLFGFNAVIFLACALVTSLLVRHLIRENVLNLLWLTLLAIAVQGLLGFAFSYAIWEYDGVQVVLLRQTLPTAVLTTLVSPVAFWVIRKLSHWFNREEPKGLEAVREEYVPEKL